MSELGKITQEHRRRQAVVYVRQSSMGQLERNVESAARQYGLRERAVELGWPASAVAVVDEDTGRSGASSDGRLGFKELVAEVGLGHVGLILALETSRLARCSADWHRLLDLCALTGTLIADSDGVYQPSWSPIDELLREILGQARQRQVEAFTDLIRLREEEAYPVTLARAWSAISGPPGEPYLRMFTRLHDTAGEPLWAGFRRTATTDWLAPLEDGLRSLERPELATVVLAVIRGLLMDLDATGDTARTNQAFDDFLTTIDSPSRSQ